MKLSLLHRTVGKTRSEKVVVCALELEGVKSVSAYLKAWHFSVDDLLDARAIFEYLSIRSEKKKDTFTELYSEHSSEIRHLLSHEAYEEAKVRANILTVVDLRNLGETLVNVEFKVP